MVAPTLSLFSLSLSPLSPSLPLLLYTSHSQPSVPFAGRGWPAAGALGHVQQAGGAARPPPVPPLPGDPQHHPPALAPGPGRALLTLPSSAVTAGGGSPSPQAYCRRSRGKGVTGFYVAGGQCVDIVAKKAGGRGGTVRLQLAPVGGHLSPSRQAIAAAGMFLSKCRHQL
jgi:hypothetical protein